MSEPVWRELNAWVMEHAGPLSSSSENDLCDIVGRLVAAENEACAKIAESIPEREGYTSDRLQYSADVARTIAAAIRARGTVSFPD